MTILSSLRYASATVPENRPDLLRVIPIQTFLPYEDYTETARCLRDKELENQRLHVKMLLDTLHEIDELTVQVWRSHPAVDMWKGYEAQLAVYGLAMCDEWTRRFGTDKLTDYIQWHLDNVTCVEDFVMEKPPWMRRTITLDALVRNHRGVLIAKDPVWYSRYKWEIAPCTAFFWPRADGKE